MEGGPAAEMAAAGGGGAERAGAVGPRARLGISHGTAGPLLMARDGSLGAREHGPSRPSSSDCCRCFPAVKGARCPGHCPVGAVGGP